MAQLLYDQFNRPIKPSEARVRPGRVFSPSVVDRWNVYPIRNITPSLLDSILRQAEHGNAARQVELFRQIPERDGHILSQTGTRKNAVTGLDWEIVAAGDDSKADKAAELCREVINGLEEFDDLLIDLVEAIIQGWAINELVWDSSSGQAWIVGHELIKAERTVWDDAGVPRLLTDAEPIKGEEIPPFKVAYHTNTGRSGIHPARAGLMRTNSWWWLFKNFSVKDWASFAEVFGLPLRVGKYPNGASPNDIDALHKALKSLGTDASAVVSEDTKIEFIDAVTRGSGKVVFEGLVAVCNQEISKATLGQTLTSDVGKIGSYGAAKVHDEVRKDIRDADAKALGATIRRQMLKPLTLFNFGPDVPAPHLVFDLEEAEDLSKAASTLKTLRGAGLRIGTDFVYSKFGIPKPKADEEVLGDEAEPKAPAKKPAKQASVRPSLELEIDASRAQAAIDRMVKAFNKAVSLAAGDADSVQAAIERLADASITQASAVSAAMVARLVKAIAPAGDWDDLQRRALAAYRDIKAPALGSALEAAVLISELNGRLSASTEAGGGSGQGEVRSASLAAMRGHGRAMVLKSGVEFLDRPVQPIEAIQFYRGKLPLNPDQFNRVQAEAKARAFTVAGVYEEDLLAAMFDGIGDAIRTGTTVEAFRAQVDEMFIRAGFAGPQPHHLDTVFRNNVQSAYMGGRYKQLAEVVDQRPYWQYSAVMDGNTRPSHAAQDGKVYPAVHDYWTVWYPPNGHRCRCDVISLSEDEVQAQGLDVETDAPALEPDAGWDHNVGQAGWGSSIVEASFGGQDKPGPWQVLGNLKAISDRAPATIPRPTTYQLPDHHGALLRQLGSEQAVRDHYRQEAIDRLGLQVDGRGRLMDLPLRDANGDRAVLAARMLDYVDSKGVGRGRYMGIAKDVMEQADEIWLVPGIREDGRIAMRKRYLKAVQPGKGEALMVLAETERGVWQAWSTYPAKWKQVRQGLLIYQRP